MRSVHEFLDEVNKLRELMRYREDDPWEPWFRGQKKADWKLRPKLYRGRQLPSKKDLRKREDEIREEFIKRAPIWCEALPAVDEMRAEWEWYFMMQHHKAATRLLDWTDGALIALCFAVKDNCGDNEAAVWVLDPYALNKRASKKKWAKREWVIPPSATGVDPEIRKDLDRWLPRRFLQQGQRLPRRAVAIEPTHLVRRMSSQHSCFTIHGSDPEALDKLEGERNPYLVKIVVLRSRVREIERELRRCGVDESTIFPDLDGLGRSINARWGMRDEDWPKKETERE